MGLTSSKVKQHPYPLQQPAYYGHPQQFPGYGQGFIPPGYGAPPPLFPQPQVAWPAQQQQQQQQQQQPRKKKKKRSRHEPVYPNGYVPASQIPRSHGQGQSTQHSASQPPPFIPPPPGATQHSQHPGQAPPPLFTPLTGNHLTNFPSPQVQQSMSRRAPTPFIPPFADDDEEDSDSTDDEPVLPSSHPQFAPSNTFSQSGQLHATEASHNQVHAPPPGQFRPVRHAEQPPIQGDIADVLTPLEPANPSAFGPPGGPTRQRTLRNPLPPPPRDLYEMTPYKSLLNLPQTTALLTASYGNSAVQPTNIRTGGGASLVPSASTRVSNKKPKKGLFRAFSTSRKQEDVRPVPESGQSNVRFVPVFVPTAENAGVPGAGAGAASGMRSTTFTTPLSSQVPAGASDIPIRFAQQGTYAGFMNHSPHRVLFQNKTYPTATHLHEAMKYLEHRPEIAEQIRNCREVKEVYPLSAKYQQFQRQDWGAVFLKFMEDVIFCKFKQHPDLRSLLMSTGNAPLVYEDARDAYWGDGPNGGANQLGHALVRVRERLRAEGYM